MKPEYVNAFVISSNSSRNEVVLTFFNEYPELNHDGFARMNQDDQGMNKSTVRREMVASILLTADTAKHLGFTLMRGAQESNKRNGK